MTMADRREEFIKMLAELGDLPEEELAKLLADLPDG